MSDNNTAANHGYNVNEVYGKIVVIKRTGQDSASFELMDDSYTFGRAADCDIRIQLNIIAEQHCKIIRNEHGQAVLVKLNEDGLSVNNLALKEESRVLEHNDIFTLIERSFRYEFTPEMLAKAQLASSHSAECAAGTIPLSMETPKKPSSLSASVFSISEVPSSPATPKTPVPALRVNSSNGSNVQSPRVVASPMGSNVVDSEITTSPKLSPKVFKLETEVLGSVSAFNIVGASSLGSNVVSSTDGHAECDKENAMPVELTENVTSEGKSIDNEEPAEVAEPVVVADVETDKVEALAESETVCETVVEAVAESAMDTEVTAEFECVMEAEAVSETAAENVQGQYEPEMVIEEVEAVCEKSAENCDSVVETSEVTEPCADNVITSTETSEYPVGAECEIIEASTEEVTEVCADIVMDSTAAAETAESTDDVIMSEVTETVNEIVAEACENIEMTESTVEIADAVVENVTDECNDVPMENVEVVETCEAEMATAGAVEATESFIEASETSGVTDSVMETAGNSEAVTETVETTEVTDVNEPAEITDSVMEGTDTVDALMETEDVDNNTESVAEVAETIIETSEPVMETSETADIAESCEISVADSAMVCETFTETGEEQVTVAAEVSVEEITTVDSVLESTEQVVQSVDEAVIDETTEERAVAEDPVDTVDASVVEAESVAPVETVIPSMPEASEVTEPKSAESFVNAYESSSETNSPMEGVEVTEQVIKEQAENIEALMTIETETADNIESVTATTETVEVTEKSEVVESPVESSVDSAPVIAAEVESVKESEEMQSAAEVTEPVENTSTPASINEPSQSHNEDNLEVSIEPLEEAVVEIHAGNQEIASIEIASVDIPASPSRKESDELDTSTPAPQRKSTRVHVSPKALESVKKQEASSAGESGNKRALRSTGRQLRSRLGTEPTSPKSRSQKRSATDSDDENVDPACLSLPLDSKKTKSSASESDNTPLRRSTRSRVQK